MLERIPSHFPAAAFAEHAFSRRPVEQNLARLLRELAPWRVEIESELLGESGKDHLLEISVGLTPRQHDALEDADARVAEYELLAHFAAGAESAAGGAGAERRVEREVARLELRERDAADRAAVSLGEEMGAAVVLPLNFDQTFGELERGLDGIVETAAIFGAHHEAVDDDGDVVVHPPIELRRIGDFDQIAVDDRADESLLARGLEQLAELAFAAAHERSEDLDLRVLPAR